MSHTPNRDYRKSVKSGIGIEVGLLVLGESGQIIAPRIQGTVRDWEITLFVALSVLGILVVVLSVFGLGIALPLLE